MAGTNPYIEKSEFVLPQKNYDVTFDLKKDVDVIFCFDPRPNHAGLWYQDFLNQLLKKI